MVRILSALAVVVSGLACFSGCQSKPILDAPNEKMLEVLRNQPDDEIIIERTAPLEPPNHLTPSRIHGGI